MRLPIATGCGRFIAAGLGGACWLMLMGLGLGQQSLTTPYDPGRAGNMQANPYGQSSPYSLNPPSFSPPIAIQPGITPPQMAQPNLAPASAVPQAIAQPASSPYEQMWKWIRQANEAKLPSPQPGNSPQELKASGGVKVRRIADIGLAFHQDTSEGLVISFVAPSGAIARSGFRRGDYVLSINGARVACQEQFHDRLFAPQLLNERVKVILWRNGRSVPIWVEPSVLLPSGSDPSVPPAAVSADQNP
jgi:PDZ domain-containing protein